MEGQGGQARRKASRRGRGPQTSEGPAVGPRVVGAKRGAKYQILAPVPCSPLPPGSGPVGEDDGAGCVGAGVRVR
jgi:hypothetical protein